MIAYKRTTIRNRILVSIMTIFAVLVMATPVFANSSSWWFLAYYDGYIVNGNWNGIYHTMTAGSLQISGSITTTAIYGTPVGAQPWYFDVSYHCGLFNWWRCTVCTAGPVPVPLYWNQTTSFSKSCGTIPARQYYLVIYRNALDNREVTGSGTLTTQ